MAAEALVLITKRSKTPFVIWTIDFLIDKIYAIYQHNDVRHWCSLTDVFYVCLQVEWRDEVRHHFEKIKSEGTCLHRLDEELIKRRREELRLADAIMTRTKAPWNTDGDALKVAPPLRKTRGMWKPYIYGCQKINVLIDFLFLVLFSQTRAGHPGALREEAGASQQSVHGAQRHHAAAGDQRERTAQVWNLQ